MPHPVLFVTQIVTFTWISGFKYRTSIFHNLSVLIEFDEIILPLYHKINLKLLLVYHALSVTVRRVGSLRKLPTFSAACFVFSWFTYR
jgi:hypothetical protein